jgi:hypothetical protein
MRDEITEMHAYMPKYIIWPEWVELNDSLWWMEASYGENKKKRQNGWGN